VKENFIQVKADFPPFAMISFQNKKPVLILFYKKYINPSTIVEKK